MAESTHIHRTTLPPHIHSENSLGKRYWGQCVALAPVFVAGCFTGHAEILRVLLICLVSAITFDLLSAKLFQKKENIQNGETIFAAILFALLLPSRCPSEAVILGVFMATFMAKGLLGGTGSYPLHPLLLARVFLQFCFPRMMAEPMLLTGEGSVWIFSSIALGGAFFLRQKQGCWKTAGLFVALCFIFKIAGGGKEMSFAFFSGVFLTAFFLLGDPVTLPLTRKGTLLFVAGAAFLSSRFEPEGFSIRSTSFAILAMNLLTPWMDVWLKPLPYKAKRTIKATYSS